MVTFYLQNQMYKKCNPLAIRAASFQIACLLGSYAVKMLNNVNFGLILPLEMKRLLK